MKLSHSKPQYQMIILKVTPTGGQSFEEICKAIFEADENKQGVTLSASGATWFKLEKERPEVASKINLVRRTFA